MIKLNIPSPMDSPQRWYGVRNVVCVPLEKIQYFLETILFLQGKIESISVAEG